MSGRLSPPDDGDLSTFPAEETIGEATVFRAHHTSHPNPWWFAHDDRGRFNLAYPNGTCYVADDSAAALLEVVRQRYRGRYRVERSLIDQVAVTELPLPDAFLAANVTHEDAVHFGVNRSINDTPDYEVTRQWAQRFHDAGFDGVRYATGFTSGMKANAWAVFGDAGPAESRPYGETRMAADVFEELGYTLVDDREEQLPDSGIDVRPSPAG